MKIKGLILVVLFIINGCSRITNNSNGSQSQKPNILLICIDDLRPELNSYGASHIISPNIDSLANKGVMFTNHYVNAPSCGPSRYTLLTGLYGSPHNNALFTRAKKITDAVKVQPSMPEWFKNNGYSTVSVGKVSHHPGGRGGNDWNDSLQIEMPNAWDKHLVPVGEWQHPRGIMHGLANGEIRNIPKEMDVYQSKKKGKYPDDLIMEEAIYQLKDLGSNNKPYFLAVGLLKPHLPFGAPKKFYDLYKNVTFPEIKNQAKPSFRTTWHSSSEFKQYNLWDKDPNKDEAFALELRKHYAACVSYTDAQIGILLHQLKKSGLDKNTIIILWGDHGWHLGEHAIWGKHSLFEESLKSPLIIYNPKNLKHKTIEDIVETSDIFPTLCDVAGIEIPDFAVGISLHKLVKDGKSLTKPAFAYSPSAKTIKTKEYRLILHNDGYVELYNHKNDLLETDNVAKENSDIVKNLIAQLEKRGL